MWYSTLKYLHSLVFLNIATWGSAPSLQLSSSVQLHVRQGGVSLKPMQSSSQSHSSKHSLSSTLCSTLLPSGHFSGPVRSQPEKMILLRISVWHCIGVCLSYFIYPEMKQFAECNIFVAATSTFFIALTWRYLQNQVILYGYENN